MEEGNDMKKIRRRNVKQNWLIIGVLSALFVFSTGYALLATQLNIRGTSQISANFNVYIASITEKKVYRATTNSTSVGADKLTANFDVGLELPGSYAEYTVVVKNDSNFNVELKEIQGIDEANQKVPTEIQYSISGITKGEILEKGGTKEFTVRVDFDSDATSLPSMGKTLEIELNYEQTTSSSTLPPTTETCFETNSTGETITDYLCSDTITDVIIPSTINGKTITTIGTSAFSAKGLTSVTISNEIENIEDRAFFGNDLTVIDIPDSVKSIGQQSFGLNQLQRVNLSNSLTTIAFGAFWENQIETVVIPDSVISIEGSAFSNNSITSVTLSNNLQTIGSSAFLGSQLANLTIPSSVITIGDQAFATNDNMTITNLTGRAFDWCNICDNDSYEHDLCTFATGSVGNVTVIAG